MRIIAVVTPDSKIWKRWINDCKKASKELEKSVQNGDKPQFKENLYKRKSIKTEFFFSKDAPFYGKCAYCENDIVDFQHGDIEHFRPKAAVTDENDDPINHDGYYWLAYDWRNLLPSCAKCNQPSTNGDQKIGKHNRFPVIGKHAQYPHEIDNEKPLLINPASQLDEDDPSKHLAVDLKYGLLIPLTERGQMCIDVFGLNIRDQLVDGRKRAIIEMQGLLAKLSYENDSTTTIREIREIKEGRRAYTTASITALKNYLARLEEI